MVRGCIVRHLVLPLCTDDSVAAVRWFAGLHYSLGTIMNNKIFVAEMLEILISFIGVLITVPMTAWVMTKRRRQLVDRHDESNYDKNN